MMITKNKEKKCENEKQTAIVDEVVQCEAKTGEAFGISDAVTYHTTRFTFPL